MTKSVRELKQEITLEVARGIRKRRREEFSIVAAKSKVETYDDMVAIFYGLSRKAKDRAVLDRILLLAKCGNSPAEIIKSMEPIRAKKRNANCGQEIIG